MHTFTKSFFCRSYASRCLLATDIHITSLYQLRHFLSLIGATWFSKLLIWISWKLILGIFCSGWRIYEKLLQSGVLICGLIWFKLVWTGYLKVTVWFESSVHPQAFFCSALKMMQICDEKNRNDYYYYCNIVYKLQMINANKGCMCETSFDGLLYYGSNLNVDNENVY